MLLGAFWGGGRQVGNNVAQLFLAQRLKLYSPHDQNSTPHKICSVVVKQYPVPPVIRTMVII